MALSAEVSVVSAHSDKGDKLVVTLKLILTDNGEEVLNQNFTQNHNPDNPISVARDAMLEKMQSTIDDFKEGQEMRDSAALSNAIAYIENNLEM